MIWRQNLKGAFQASFLKAVFKYFRDGVIRFRIMCCVSMSVPQEARQSRKRKSTSKEENQAKRPRLLSWRRSSG